ncbi:MAG: DUF3299 domain-containing protein [Gemmataceae bacterium]
MKPALTISALLLSALPAAAGLHFSGETIRELPARWTGYLPDHRALRNAANPRAASPIRDLYADAALRLQTAAKQRPLTADEAADLGAALIRLGQPAQALDTLRPAARRHPDHFRLAANLGTAWQQAGDLGQAALALEDAVRLAPPAWERLETLHLKLVRLRLAEGKSPKDAPNALFDPPPTDALALAQHLALWLPADGRLLWLLAELAHAAGDVRTAANLLDGCVTEFNLASPAVRTRRQQVRAEADAAERAGHAPPARGFKSARALARGIDPARLPAIRPDGLNPLPWAVLAETEIGPRGQVTFLKHLEQLDGRRVTLTGYMTTPGAGEPEAGGFLLTEFPVGCWFCEVPGPTQLVSVELADGTTARPVRTAVRVTGVLRLNRTDPERLPVAIDGATVGPAD